MSTGTPISPIGSAHLSRRRLLGIGAAIAGGAVGSGVLSACGGSPRPTASSSKSAPALVKPSGKVTLTLWTWAWPEAPADTQLQNAFQAAVPEVTLQVKKFPYPDYTTALRTGVPNGTAGDVLHLQTGSMIKQYAQYLVPLDGYAADAFGADWRKQFLSGSVEEIEASKVGLVALPQQFSVGGVMFANRKLLSSVGGEVPNSYDQYLALSPKLAGRNAVAASWGAKDDWPNTDYLVQFASQYKPGIIAKAEAGEASFADDAVVVRDAVPAAHAEGQAVERRAVRHHGVPGRLQPLLQRQGRIRFARDLGCRCAVRRQPDGRLDAPSCGRACRMRRSRRG